MGADKEVAATRSAALGKKKRKRAATTRLEPGEHSIDRAAPRESGARGVVLLDWSVRLWDGRLAKRRSQGTNIADARRRAKATARELLTTGGSQWKTTSKLGDFIDQVTRPAIDGTPLRERSKASYHTAVNQILGDCANHKHAFALRGLPIASGMRLRSLEACIREIVELHGPSCGKRARTVLSKYVIQQLNREELLTGNPLRGVSVSLRLNNEVKTDEYANPQRKALNREEHQLVLEHLLDLDPAEGIEKPNRGVWTLEDRVAKRRNAVDLTLLQATTGLRVSEANALTWRDVTVADDGTVYVYVREDVSKTHKSRRVPVLDERVANRIARRFDPASPAEYVIGSPADSFKEWDQSNCRKVTTQLYLELADVLGIEPLRHLRTHVWRATLNTLLKKQLDVVVRAAYFGHDPEINKSSYTDVTDTSEMLEAARALRL